MKSEWKIENAVTVLERIKRMGMGNGILLENLVDFFRFLSGILNDRKFENMAIALEGQLSSVDKYKKFLKTLKKVGNGWKLDKKLGKFLSLLCICKDLKKS